MRTTLGLLFGLSLFGALIPELQGQQPCVLNYEPCCAPTCCEYPTSCRSYYVRAEAVWLKRSNGDGVLLGTNTNFVVDPSGVTTETLSTDDQSFDYELGPRITLGCFLDECNCVELSYAGLQRWTSSRTIFGDSVAGTILLNSPWLTIDDPDVGIDTSLGYSYRSRLHDVELNMLGDMGCCAGAFRASFLGGIRYINLEEKLRLTGVNTFPTPSAESVNISTRNNLVGLQIGAELIHEVGQGVCLELRGKVGLYVNSSHQDLIRQVTNDAGTVTNLAGSTSDSTFATCLEAGVFVRWQVSHCITVRGGYQVLFLTGLALAPDQLESNIGPDRSANHVNNNGDALFHGPSIGVEITWGGDGR